MENFIARGSVFVSAVNTLVNMVRKSVTATAGVSAFSFPQVLAGALIAYLICFVLFFRKKGPGRNIAIALLFLYAGILFALTVPVVMPARWHISPAATDWAIHSIGWVPFLSASNLLQNASASGNWTEFIRVIGGNVLVFLPLGILVPLVNPKFRFGRMLLLAILVPVCIESLQLAGNILSGTVIRTVETEDVILNAAGCLIGYLLYAGIHRARTPRHYAKHYR
jgi:glycopeptide antibiotics resistance protein